MKQDEFSNYHLMKDQNVIFWLIII